MVAAAIEGGEGSSHGKFQLERSVLAGDRRRDDPHTPLDSKVLDVASHRDTSLFYTNSHVAFLSWTFVLITCKLAGIHVRYLI